MMDFKDPLKRQFKTLRVSLTAYCNLACVYCVHESEAAHNPALPTFSEVAPSPQNKDLPLDLDEYLAIVQAMHEICDLETVRLTGGEPFLFRDLVPLIRRLKRMGIPKVKMTSNAFLLSRHAWQLKEAGLDSLNVSLEALDPDTFKKVTRRDKLDITLQGIEKALEAGIPMKINAVIMRGLNDQEILPLFEYAKERSIPIRFLELMKMGHLFQEHNDYFFSEEDILWTIAREYDFTGLKREKASTANYWETTDGYKFGIIANESSPFCHDCNRLRLDSYGYIYGCLSSEEGIDVKSIIHHPVQLKQKLRYAMSQKQLHKFTGSGISMKAIGG